MVVRDKDILLVRNTKGINLLNRIFYTAIRFFLNSYYNHVVMIREFNGELYVVESKSNGFNVTKTYNKFLEEQNKFKRDLKIIRLNTYNENRFKETLGNKYNLFKFSGDSMNCFGSIAYVFGIKPKALYNYKKIY